MSCKIFDTPENCKTNEHDDCIRCVFGPNGRRTQSYDEWYAEWKSKSHTKNYQSSEQKEAEG